MNILRILEAKESPANTINSGLSLNWSASSGSGTGYAIQGHEIAYPELESVEDGDPVPVLDRLKGLVHTVPLIVKGRDHTHLTQLVGKLSRRLMNAVAYDGHDHPYPGYLQVVPESGEQRFVFAAIRDYDWRYTSDAQAQGIYVVREGVLVIRTGFFTDLLYIEGELWQRTASGKMLLSQPDTLDTKYIQGFTFGQARLNYTTLANARRPGGINVLRPAVGGTSPTVSDNIMPTGDDTSGTILQSGGSPLYLYIASAHADGQGPFSAIEFDLSTLYPAPFTTPPTWNLFQYWNGSAWADLHGVKVTHGQFISQGRHIISFTTPKAWGYGTPTGVTSPGYWLRFRTNENKANQIVQGTNQKVFAPFLPFVDLPAIESDVDYPIVARIGSPSTDTPWNTLYVAHLSHDEFPTRQIAGTTYSFPYDAFYSFTDRPPVASIPPLHGTLETVDSAYSDFAYSGNAPSGRCLQILGTQFGTAPNVPVGTVYNPTLSLPVNLGGRTSFYIRPGTYRVFLRFMAEVDETLLPIDPETLQAEKPSVTLGGYFISKRNRDEGRISGNTHYMRSITVPPAVVRGTGSIGSADLRDWIFSADLGSLNVRGIGNKARPMTFEALFGMSHRACSIRLYDVIVLPASRSPLVLRGVSMENGTIASGNLPQAGYGLALWPRGRGYRAQLEGVGLHHDVLSEYNALGNQTLWLKPNVANRLYFFAMLRPVVQPTYASPGVVVSPGIGSAPTAFGVDISSMDWNFAVQVTALPGFLLPK